MHCGLSGGACGSNLKGSWPGGRGEARGVAPAPALPEEVRWNSAGRPTFFRSPSNVYLRT
jgi:hypothetical protein